MITKTKRYGKSIIKRIRKRLPEDSLSVLNAFNILVLSPRNVYSEEFEFYRGNEIIVLANNDKISETELKDEWDTFEFKFESKEIKNIWILSKEKKQINLKRTPSKWTLCHIHKDFQFLKTVNIFSS